MRLWTFGFREILEYYGVVPQLMLSRVVLSYIETDIPANHMVARSKVWNIFAHRNTEVVSLNPSQDTDVCDYYMSVLSDVLVTALRVG
jgi:hypothetical protein